MSVTTMDKGRITNIVIAGLGGQGVLKATDVLSDALLRTGVDIKKSEVHGMSQRGGSVASDVRFGPQVFSPMVPTGEADFLVIFAPEWIEAHRAVLKKEGVLITPELIDTAKLANKKSLNVALLGYLSTFLEVPESCWLDALHDRFPEKLHANNLQAFNLGRSLRTGTN